jgi:hypothetical protein
MKDGMSLSGMNLEGKVAGCCDQGNESSGSIKSAHSLGSLSCFTSVSSPKPNYQESEIKYFPFNGPLSSLFVQVIQ